MDVKTFTLPVLVFGIMPALSVKIAHGASANGRLGAVSTPAGTPFADGLYRGCYPRAA
jgi:hypothetical protein